MNSTPPSQPIIRRCWQQVAWHRQLFAFSLLVLAGATDRAFAQTVVAPAAAPRPAPSSLEQELKWLQAESIKITTASLRSESIGEAPATVRVVTSRQIRERGYRNLLDVLGDLPGMDVLNHVQAEAMNRIGVRGVTGNNKVLLLQNGVRINSPTGEPIIQIADNYPLYNAKQVEVVYGPASSLYGADAFTGVINIITADPAEVNGIQATVEAGEFDSWYASVYGGRKFSDTFSLALGGYYHETAGADLADAYPRDFVLRDLKTFAGVTVVPAARRRGYRGPERSFGTYGRMELGPNITLGFNQSLFISRTDQGSVPDATDYGANAYNKTLLATIYGQYRFELGAHVNGRINLNYSRYEQLPTSRFHAVFNSFTDGFKYGLGERFQAEPTLAVDWDRHNLTTGVTAEYFNSIPHTANLPRQYDTGKEPGDQAMSYPGTGLPIEIFRTHYSNAGAFAQMQSHWTDRVSSTLGFRLDHNSDYGTSFNPRAGLVVQLSPQSTVKALYGEAFLAPAPFFRYENFGTLSDQKNPQGLYIGSRLRVPNPALEPEKMRTIELSLAHHVSERLELSITGYRQRVSNIISAVTLLNANNTKFIPGAILLVTDQNQNIGEQKALGTEVAADYTVAASRNLRAAVRASFSYVDGHLTDRSSGARLILPLVSREMAKTGFTLNYHDRYDFDLTGQWIGGQAGYAPSPADPNFNKRLPGYALVNLFAQWRPTKHLAFYLRARNLLDRRYVNGGLSGFATFFAAPQDSRWITLGARYDY